MMPMPSRRTGSSSSTDNWSGREVRAVVQKLHTNKMVGIKQQGAKTGREQVVDHIISSSDRLGLIVS